MSMDDKKYAIDGDPSSARDIIKMAQDLDGNFGRDGFLSTSEAASILRRRGMIVEHNKEAE